MTRIVAVALAVALDEPEARDGTRRRAAYGTTTTTSDGPRGGPAQAPDPGRTGRRCGTPAAGVRRRAARSSRRRRRASGESAWPPPIAAVAPLPELRRVRRRPAEMRQGARPPPRARRPPRRRGAPARGTSAARGRRRGSARTWSITSPRSRSGAGTVPDSRSRRAISSWSCSLILSCPARGPVPAAGGRGAGAT